MEVILITGGCGQRGLLEVQNRLQQGHKIIVYDNLSRGGFAAKNLIPAETEFIFGDVRDELMLRRVLKDKSVTRVVHFAAVARDHSIEDYEVNTGGLLKLQKVCEEFGIVLDQA